ncbi:MAG: methyl-accepting chemotaxis protein, partial [Frateuria sp.]|nr:methyl-accepting chemotaxis protein [Frateuria sp.]
VVAAMAQAGRTHAQDVGSVAQAAERMQAMTQENAALGEQAAAASHSLMESAHTLLDVVGFFSLAEERHVEGQPRLPRAEVMADVALSFA